MTARPSAGPASAYAIFRTPASTCFKGPNGVAGRDAAPATAVKAANPATLRRRPRRLSSFAVGPSSTGRTSIVFVRLVEWDMVILPLLVRRDTVPPILSFVLKHNPDFQAGNFQIFID